MTRIDGNAALPSTHARDLDGAGLQAQPLEGDALVAKVLQAVVVLRERALAEGHRNGGGTGGDAEAAQGEVLHAQRRLFQERLLGEAPPTSVPQAPLPAAAAGATGPQPAPERPVSPMLWNDYALHTTNAAALRQGALTPTQSQLSAAISGQLVAQASGGDPSRLMAMRPQDFASLAQLAGVRPGLLSEPQLQSAARFVNTATSAAHQQDRLNASLNALQAAQSLSAPPQLTAQEMKDQLRATLGLDERAFRGIDAARIQAGYEQVAAAMQAPGQHALQLGKDTVRFDVLAPGELGAVTQSSRGLLFDRILTLREAPASVPPAATQAAAAPQPAPTPEPSVQEMKQELVSMFGMKEKKAFKKMRDDDVRAKYAEVMSALATPGSHQFKIGKYKVSFNVGANGEVSDLKCKKKGILGTILKGVLTVASFIPIPWIAIPARIISAGIAIVEAAKAKSLLGIVAGVASAVAGGAGALAGTALQGLSTGVQKVATGVAKVASATAKVARGVEAGIKAVKDQSVLGVVSAAASVAGGVAGAFAKGAEAAAAGAQKVSDWSQKVTDWSQRVLIGAKVVVDIKQGKVMDAIAGGTSLAGSFGDELSNAGGQLKPFAEQLRIVTDKVQTYTGYANDAVGVAKGLASGDFAGALSKGAGLADRIDAEWAAPGQSDDPSRVTVGRVLGYASSGVGAVQHFARGDVQAGLQRTSALVGNAAPLVSPNSGWSQSVQRLLNSGADIAGVVDDIRDGRLQAAFDKAPGAIGSLGWNLTDAGLLKPTEAGQPPKAVQTAQAWAGYVRDGYALADDIGHGRTDDAVARGIALANGVSDAVSRGPGLELEAGAGWARSAQRVVDAATEVPTLAGELREGDVEGALDRAAGIVTRAGGGIADLIVPQNNAMPVLQDIGLWMGRGADAWHAVDQVRTGDYRGAAYQVLDVTADLLPEAEASRVRERAAPAIDAADELQQAVVRRDAVRTVVEAAQFIDALRRAFARQQAAQDVAEAVAR